VPRYPELHGAERFSGPAFHSSTWDYSVDLDGKNVAVVGTGASAIQFVPQIAPRVGKLYLFQRTPPWIVPRLDFAITDKWKRRFRAGPSGNISSGARNFASSVFSAIRPSARKSRTLPAAISRAGSKIPNCAPR
ncbi:MAG: hypothetical protein DMG51_07320, partial [Acidobacteria bacterium]